jgi:hypothetical protein
MLILSGYYPFMFCILCRSARLTLYTIVYTILGLFFTFDLCR